MEEENGLSKHAMDIYNRATKAVEKDEMHLVIIIIKSTYVFLDL